LSRVETLKSRLAPFRVGLNLSSTSSLPERTGGVKVINSSKTPERIAIQAHPKQPPFSLLFFLSYLRKSMSISTKIHIHSSLRRAPARVLDFFGEDESSCSNFNVCINLIWKDVDHPRMIISPQKHVQGEVDMARYFCRIIKELSYEEKLSGSETAFVDAQLDLVQQFLKAEPLSEKRQHLLLGLGKALEKHPWLSGKHFSIVDILVWSHMTKCSNSKLKQWHKKVSDLPVTQTFRLPSS
jgi:hypothetical protein